MIVLPLCLLLTAPLLYTPLRCGSLFLVGCCIINYQSAAIYGHNVFFFNLLPLHLTPQTMGQRSPHIPPRSPLLSNAPLIVDDHFTSVGCCVPTLNDGHLRPRVRPSLYFFVD